MNTDHKDFIGIYGDVYPQGYCQHLISEFERLVDGGAGINRQRSEGAARHRKDDLQLSLNIRAHNMFPFQNCDAVNMFFDGLQKCYDIYTDQFSVLKDASIRSSHMKMQRTLPGGGYHIWHNEQDNKHHAERVLAYILYLNSLPPEDAGETEFLYQQQRFNPKENQIILWPAAFTHTHRGNTVFGKASKYVVTGWFYYD